jgi:hypothetical protein
MDKIKKLAVDFLRMWTERMAPSAGYFIGQDKIYLASADQFAGMREIVEADNILPCSFFYSVIGGLGGLNVLARLDGLEEVTLFDINPFAIETCRLVLEIIKNAENRDSFISMIYARNFDSARFSCENQDSFYALKLEQNRLERLKQSLPEELYECYMRVYFPYIQNPTQDKYDGASRHCTRLTVFHEAPIDGVMSYPFIAREKLMRRHITSVNSFFFGKGWLANEERYQRVRKYILMNRVKIQTRSIFELGFKPHSGLYASNLLDGREKNFSELIYKFSWVLWYSKKTHYLKLEYLIPGNRLIPFDKIYGKAVKNPHQSCCDLLNDHFNLNKDAFIEVIQPHIQEGMNYGFRFYAGQFPISVEDFLNKDLSETKIPNIIGIHILMGGGCLPDIWKKVVIKAVKSGKTIFLFEHRKECKDWPEQDVNDANILPEAEIDKFLLSLGDKWHKYGAANKWGDILDIRNICYLIRR